MKRLLRDRLADCYLARRGDEYVGFIVLSWSFSMSKGYPVLRVEALYTWPPYRNMGVGRALLQHATQLAKEKKPPACNWKRTTTTLPPGICTPASVLREYRARECTCVFWDLEKRGRGHVTRGQNKRDLEISGQVFCGRAVGVVPHRNVRTVRRPQPLFYR